jgi:hypothetical protein
LWKLCRKLHYTFGKWYTFILGEIPVFEIYLIQKVVDRLSIVEEIFVKNIVRIPINQNIAEIEDYGLDGSSHYRKPEIKWILLT